MSNFKKLDVWTLSMQIVKEVYKLTKSYPVEERYGLASQTNRAAVSIPSNIAEGFGRKSYKEKLQFYYLSQGSLTELKNFILISKDVGYLKDKEFAELVNQANQSHKLLQGLIQKTKSFVNS